MVNPNMMKALCVEDDAIDAAGRGAESIGKLAEVLRSIRAVGGESSSRFATLTALCEVQWRLARAHARPPSTE